MSNEKEFNWFFLFLLTLLASGGSLMKLTKEAQNGRRFNTLILVRDMLVSTVAGLIFGIATLGFVDNIFIAMAVSGLAGRIGTLIFDLVEELLKTRTKEIGDYLVKKIKGKIEGVGKGK